MTENNTTIRSTDPINENNQNQTEQEEIIQNLKNINIDSEDLTSLIKDLETFEMPTNSPATFFISDLLSLISFYLVILVCC